MKYKIIQSTVFTGVDFPYFNSSNTVENISFQLPLKRQKYTKAETIIEIRRQDPKLRTNVLTPKIVSESHSHYKLIVTS